MSNRKLVIVIVVGLLVLLAGGAGLYFAGAFERAPELTPVPEIEITNVDAAVQEQIRTAREHLLANLYDSKANGRLGVLYELYQYPEAARTCYERAVALSPLEFRWKYYQARIELLLGHPEVAVSLLNAALGINERYTPAVALLGEAYLETNRLDDAEAAFRRALRDSPRSCAALSGLGKTLARRGDHEAAIEQFKLALEVAPNHDTTHYAMGLSYRKLGRNDLAKRHLEMSRHGSSAIPDVDPLVAQIYEQEIGVNSVYRKAIRHLNARQYDEAIPMLQQVLEQDPDHFGAHGALGKALSFTNHPSEALVEYEKAVALNPTNIDFLRPYALLLYRASRFDEAEAALRKVLDLGGDHEDDHHILGAVMMKLNRPKEAMTEFELALERKPDHAEARRALLQVLRGLAVQAPTDADALPYLRRMTEVEPRDLLSWTKLAGVLQRTGDLRGAIAAMERALAINPNLPEIAQRLDELRAQVEGEDE